MEVSTNNAEPRRSHVAVRAHRPQGDVPAEMICCARGWQSLWQKFFRRDEHRWDRGAGTADKSGGTEQNDGDKRLLTEADSLTPNECCSGRGCTKHGPAGPEQRRISGQRSAVSAFAASSARERTSMCSSAVSRRFW